MEPIIHNAIVRPPGSSYAEGITQAGLGRPDLERARTQHAAYVAALEDAGVRVHHLAPDSDYPDSTFVEDTAVVFGQEAILTRPGADSRRGEVARIQPALQSLVRDLDRIEAPGTLDGGDVLEAGRRFLIGISERTNEAGARQLAAWLTGRGCDSMLIPIHGVPGLLHLKTGISWLGGVAVAIPELETAARSLQGDVILVEQPEAYAANAIGVNDRILLPAGAPRLAGRLRDRGLRVVELEMSEFQKMDGGLSCLSLRLP